MLLLIHCSATLFMTGLIWFVQIVHYPLFRNVGTHQFEDYERRHQRLTTWVVGPVMLLEATTAIGLPVMLEPNQKWLAWSAILLLLMIWMVTAVYSMPAHRQLSAGFSEETLQGLIRTNWIRTVAWTARSGLVMFLASQQIPWRAGQ